MSLSCQRDLFDLPPEVAYLNCAYMSPALKTAAQAGHEGITLKSKPWEITPDQFFDQPERARSLFAQLIGSSAEQVAIVPSLSYAMAIAARNLPLQSGDEIILLEGQFPSNAYVWRELAKESGGHIVTVPAPEPPSPGRNDAGWTGRILECISERTGIVAIPHCHWTDGGLIDLKAVSRRARAHGACLALDLTQSVGALPLDLTEVRPDMLAASAYKWLLGPYSMGFLYLDEKWLDGEPIEHNWLSRKDSEDFAQLVNLKDDFAPGARRFDMGEKSLFHTIGMAVAGLEQLNAWGVEAVAESLAKRSHEMARRARDLGFCVLPDELRAGHYLGLSRPEGLPAELMARLREEQIYVSMRGSSMRVTPHLYNTEEEIERFFGVLESSL